MIRASLRCPHRHDDGQSSFGCGPLGREHLAAPRDTFSRDGARARQTCWPRGQLLLDSLLWLLLVPECDR